MNKSFQAISMLLIFALASFSACISNTEKGNSIEQKINLFDDITYETIILDPEFIKNFNSKTGDPVSETIRAEEAWTRLGIFSNDGVEFSAEFPEWTLEPRENLLMLIIDGETSISSAREKIMTIEGVITREYIWPSGLIVQGTNSVLEMISEEEWVSSSHNIPLAMILEDNLLEKIIESQDMSKVNDLVIRIETWRNEQNPGFTPSFTLNDGEGEVLLANVNIIANEFLNEYRILEEGRIEGILEKGTDLSAIIKDPSVAWVKSPPVWIIQNDYATSNMQVQYVESTFNIDLNGSGQIVGVADSGIDHDHGDFGSRIIGKVDVIGDGSTADQNSGHGTHVACTVLGDGTRDQRYDGVAPQAELYFQALEHDVQDSFYSPSLNSLFNSAYSAGVRTHTNSWGDYQNYGEYTTDSEDVDDRANAYDRYYSGYDGLTILFAAGNDGPSSGSVSPPATAKNPITVGSTQNRYSGAGNIMQSSARGPTDDGRIKPDLMAPGGYVRSCRAQEAQDTSGSSWQSAWYLEYTGTSMAAPNAAGAATLVREYLEEIAQRPSPQGALVKSMLILGADDIGTRDIPNNNEGWGEVNLRNTLSPTGSRGIWVDDRNSLSSGTSRDYTLNVTQNGQPLKVVLAWSDHRGSRFSSKQLVNDLNLELIAPDGTTYLGNVFSSGRSTTGGVADDTNNVEVALIDSATTGIWTVRVSDVNHGGPRSQQYAISASGVGINDLRPDMAVIVGSIQTSAEIPQVEQEISVNAQITNLGNAPTGEFEIRMTADGTDLDTYTISMSPGATMTITWFWTPTNPGPNLIELSIDPNDNVEEIEEGNNVMSETIDVTTPGVKVEASAASYTLQNAEEGGASWTLTITNTALVETDTGIIASLPVRRSDNSQMNWALSFSTTNHTLDGLESSQIYLTLSIPAQQIPPLPGTYDIVVTGIDVNNGISYPITLSMIVPDLPKFRLEKSFNVLSVSSIDHTTFTIKVYNEGNSKMGYDLELDSPSSWQTGFDDLGSNPGAPSGSTGLIDVGSYRVINITTFPPVNIVNAGTSLSMTIKATSQDETQREWNENIEMVVAEYENGIIELDTTVGELNPDDKVSLSFSITNTGNKETTYTPSVIAPGGWSSVGSLTPIVLSIDEESGFIIILEGNGYAISGPLRIYATSENGNQLIWEGQLNVKTVAQLDVDFLYMTMPDGEQYASTLDVNSHPVGETIGLTWLITNSGQTSWTPTITAEIPIGWYGECNTIGNINSGENSALICNVIISEDEVGGAEKTVKITVSAESKEVSKSVSLIANELKKLNWVNIEVPKLKQGEKKIVLIDVTNEGNTNFSARIDLEKPESWNTAIQDSTFLVLEPGESRRLRVEVTPVLGYGEIVLKVRDGTDIIGNEHKIMFDENSIIAQVSAEDNESNMGLLIAIIILLIFASVGAVIAVTILTKKKNLSSFPLPLRAPPAQVFVNQQSPPPLAAVPPPLATNPPPLIENEPNDNLN